VRLLAVSVENADVRLAGHLRLPEGGVDDGRGFPAVVIAGPLTNVKDQVPGRYAELLASSGLATLAFDPRGFGESAGEPRLHEDPHTRVADLRDAVSWLRTREEVDADRIGLVGVCFGAGPALKAAAFDPRVKALACVAAVFEGLPHLISMVGPGNYRAWLRNLAQAAQADFDQREPTYLPVVREDALPPWLSTRVGVQGVQALLWDPAAHDYYATKRNPSKIWENRVTLASHAAILGFDAVPALELMDRTPLLSVHGTADPVFSGALVEQILERGTGPMEIAWIDSSDHMDFYDDAHCTEAAAARVADFLRRKLA
jgi:fermentation-respiration switch protein FrsA (DUF1100 family)